jgi:hypothetical protein
MRVEYRTTSALFVYYFFRRALALVDGFRTHASRIRQYRVLSARDKARELNLRAVPRAARVGPLLRVPRSYHSRTGLAFIDTNVEIIFFSCKIVYYVGN